MSFASFSLRPLPSLTLTEIGGANRQFVFSGPDLPRDEGGWPRVGGIVRGVTIYYPGSPVPSSQILGSEESEIRFSGKFEDRKKGIVGWAQRQMLNLDQMRLAARPVRYDYAGITRLCKWRQAEFTQEELARIHYDVSLIVTDPEFGSSARIFSGIQQIPMVTDIITTAQTVQNVINIIPGATGVQAIQKAQGAIAGVTSGLSTADVALQSMQANGLDVNKALTALTSLDGAKKLASDAWSYLTSLNWNQVPGAVIDAVTGPGLLIATATTGVIDIAAGIGLVRPQVAAIANQALPGFIYFVRDGETLQRIAQRYYGSPSAWTTIVSANGLKSPTVTPGQRLILPNVPTQAPSIKP